MGKGSQGANFILIKEEIYDECRGYEIDYHDTDQYRPGSGFVLGKAVIYEPAGHANRAYSPRLVGTKSHIGITIRISVELYV